MSANERAMSGFTHCFVLEYNSGTATGGDFAAALYGAGTTLMALAIGDVVNRVVVDTKTAIAGPTVTPTLSVGVTGALTQFTAASSIKATTPVVSNGAPYVVTSAKNLQYDLEVGGGDGGAATAGKMIIWANITLASERNIQG